MIAFTPKRTRKLLRIRRLLTAQIRYNKPDWPQEAIDQRVTQEMVEINKLPMRKVRLVASSL
jgi:hypothetical protein